MASLFGGAAASTPNKSLFGSLSTSQPSSTGALFGSIQSQQSSNPFGGAVSTSQPQGSSLFGGATATRPSLSLFGTSTAQSNLQQSSSLFGGLGTNPQQPPPQQQQQQQPPQPPQQQQHQSSLFGASNLMNNNQPAVSSLFTRSGGLFGNSTTQPGPGASLFGRSAAAPPQNAQNQSLMQPSESLFERLQTSRIWTENEPIPPQKNVEHQLRTCARRWNPSSPDSPFQTYLYNNVGIDSAPFYRPGLNEDEQKWEDALAKAPSEGLIPVLVRGFYNVGDRIALQRRYFGVLQHRLHEINNGLSELLRRHDLEISARTAECRRRHVRLSQKCLSLATKTQILRNRGYALDPAEEELAQKLRQLEKRVMDPALGGREEEIWARMVGLRERGRILHAGFEQSGGLSKTEDAGSIDEETLKRAKKILEDYDSQLAHLANELAAISADYEDWARDRIA